MADAKQKLLIDVAIKNERALGRVNKSLKKIERSSFSMGKAAKFALGAIAAIGAVRLIGGLVNTIRTFEDLKATLVTIQGDAQKAAEAFDLIREFTKGTTFQLEEVSNAFITLRNAGLTPTQEMMTNLGNIAAGMGKRIDDVAKAVFNATTGEFEMLKQLGIKVKTQGDQLTVMFRGTATKIKNDSESIVAYLQSIGEVEFAGAIEQRLNTVSGAFSNLKDAIAEAAVQIGEQGLRGQLKDSAKEITEWINASVKMQIALGDLASAVVRLGVLMTKGFFEFIADVTSVWQAQNRMFRKMVGEFEILIGVTNRRIVQLKEFNRTYRKYFVGTAHVINQTKKQIKLTTTHQMKLDEYNMTLEESAEMQKKVEEAMKSSRSTTQAWGDGFKGAMDQFDLLTELEKAGDRTFNSLGNAIADMAMTGKFNFRDFANSVIQDLMRIAARKAIVAGFEMITGTGDSKGSILGSIWGGVKKIFGFQHGGRMGAGQPGIVGEAGPELWMPDRAGTIVPGGMGAAIGGEVNVNFNISTVDATSFDELLLSRKSLIIGTIQQAFRQQGRRFA